MMAAEEIGAQDSEHFLIDNDAKIQRRVLGAAPNNRMVPHATSMWKYSCTSLIVRNFSEAVGSIV